MSNTKIRGVFCTLKFVCVLTAVACLIAPFPANADLIIISIDTFASVEGYANSEYTDASQLPPFIESGHEDFSLTSTTSCTDSASVLLPSIGVVSAFAEGEASSDVTVTSMTLSAFLDARAETEAYGFFEELESLNSDASSISEAYAVVTFQLTTPYYYDFTADLDFLDYGPAFLQVWLDHGSDRLHTFYDGSYAVSGLLEPGMYTMGGKADFVHAYAINMESEGVHAQVGYNLTLTPVPEPSTFVLLGTGLLGLLVGRYRASNRE